MDTITYTGHDSSIIPMGYQARLTVTDKEEYKRQKQRERNKRYYEESKKYTKIKSEPNHVLKVVLLLEIIRPDITVNQTLIDNIVSLLKTV